MARPAVAREFTLCAGCGARNRPDWRVCQRCRRDLMAAPVAFLALGLRFFAGRKVAQASGAAAPSSTAARAAA